jgi:hypothetical protein
MEAIKGNCDEGASYSPPYSPTLNIDNYEPISPDSEPFGSPAAANDNIPGETALNSPAYSPTAAMDYDPMMEDDQALGPSVKIHEVNDIS